MGDLQINSIGANGSRETVEVLCRELGRLHGVGRRIVGFVDREDRVTSGFPTIEDHVLATNNVVWSLGHSMENYALDFGTLEAALGSLATVPRFKQAIMLFNRSFGLVSITIYALTELMRSKSLRVMMAAQLIDEDVLVFNRLTRTIDLDVQAWMQRFVAKATLDLASEELINAELSALRKASEDLGIEEVRWRIHGHVSMAIIVKLYRACAIKVSDGELRNSDISALNSLSVEKLYRAVMHALARRVEVGEEVIVPDVVLRVFELVARSE